MIGCKSKRNDNVNRHIKTFEAFDEGQPETGDVSFDEFIEMIFSTSVIRIDGLKFYTDDVIEEDDGIYRFDVTDDVTFSYDDNRIVREVGLRKFALNVVWNGARRQVIIKFPDRFNLSVSID